MENESTSRAIEELNALLRRELASVSLYAEVVARLRATAAPLAQPLRSMAREHARNVRTLRAEIARLGGIAQAEPGATALRLRPQEEEDEIDIVRELLACEERGLRNCQDAAGRLPSASRDLLNEVLLPARRRHLALLRSLGAGHGDCTPLRGTRTPPDTKEAAI